jgi:hypothetical protein
MLKKISSNRTNILFISLNSLLFTHLLLTPNFNKKQENKYSNTILQGKLVLLVCKTKI